MPPTATTAVTGAAPPAAALPPPPRSGCSSGCCSSLPLGKHMAAHDCSAVQAHDSGAHRQSGRDGPPPLAAMRESGTCCLNQVIDKHRNTQKVGMQIKVPPGGAAHSVLHPPRRTGSCALSPQMLV